MAIFDIFNPKKKEQYNGVDLDPAVDIALQQQLIDRGRGGEISGLAPQKNPVAIKPIVTDTMQILGDAVDSVSNIVTPQGQIKKLLQPNKKNVLEQ